MAKMTLDELRALIPTELKPKRITAEEAIEQFCWHGLNRTDPASLSDDVLMTLLMGSAAGLDPDEDSPELAEITAYANAVAREVSARVDSPKTALAWLQRNERVAKAYLALRLFCPKGKRLGELYCLPEDAEYPGKAGFRLLVVPSRRGRVTALVGDPKKSRRPGVAWWYMSDDDVWDFRCRCCPRPDGGVRAGDFLGVDKRRGYTAVLL
jgi:hypothetical protein